AALEENPQFKLALQEVKLAEANQKLERSALFPDLSAGYFIQSLTGNQDINGQNVFYNGAPRFQGFTLGVSIPIFANSAVAKSKSAKTTILAQQASADYMKEQLKNLYSKELQQLMTLQSAVEFYETSVLPSARVISKNASKSYEQGDISYVEYLQGIQTALESQIAYIKVLNQHNQSVSTIQYLLNK
ncbi:TolC family protein, partial [Fluviicola sp.]|uniref:TolC family protein n=1 Tax=Fluviicola sp. TaxID=1917219 RepID=UPI00260A8ABD